MKFEGIGFVHCPDCSSAAPVAFGVIFKRGKDATLVMIARCPWCIRRGDTRSLRATIALPTNELVLASNRGLPVLAVS